MLKAILSVLFAIQFHRVSADCAYPVADFDGTPIAIKNGLPGSVWNDGHSIDYATENVAHWHPCMEWCLEDANCVLWTFIYGSAMPCYHFKIEDMPESVVVQSVVPDAFWISYYTGVNPLHASIVRIDEAIPSSNILDGYRTEHINFGQCIDGTWRYGCTESGATCPTGCEYPVDSFGPGYVWMEHIEVSCDDNSVVSNNFIESPESCMELCATTSECIVWIWNANTGCDLYIKGNSLATCTLNWNPDGGVGGVPAIYASSVTVSETIWATDIALYANGYSVKSGASGQCVYGEWRAGCTSTDIPPGQSDNYDHSHFPRWTCASTWTPLTGCPEGMVRGNGTNCLTSCPPGTSAVNGVCYSCHWNICNRHAWFCGSGGCVDCQDHTTGSECEYCETGYFYEPGWQGAPGACLACSDNCNGHSATCDRFTGICSDCGDHTKGRHCEACSDGYSGDATDPLVGCS